MSEEKSIQAINDQQEYETRVLVFTTQFKNGFVSTFENGFNPYNFKGTRKEFDIALSEFLESDSNGKVIGVNSYTLEGWEALNKPMNYEPTEKQKANMKILEAKFESELQAKKKIRSKILTTKRD